MEIKIKIDRVFYAKNGWAACLAKEVGTSRKIRVSGTLGEIEVGMTLKVQGNWEDSKYGKQFVVSSVLSDADKPTKAGIISFLSSGFVNGIGPKKAKAIYAKFGLNTYKVIEENWRELTKVKGITERLALKIYESYMVNAEYRLLRTFLPPEIPDGKVRAIYAKYKGSSVKRLKENPYLMITDIGGIGFLTADKIAKSIGVADDDPRRVAAATLFQMQAMETEGHCYTIADMLFESAKKLIDPLPVPLFAKCLKTLRDEGSLIVTNNGRIYYRPIYYAEKESGAIIRQMTNSAPAIHISHEIHEACVANMEAATGYCLDLYQKMAVATAFEHRISVITGGPGTGKSTIVKLLLEEYICAGGDVEKIRLASPTGKAARRLEETTGQKASTIHRLLGFGRAAEDDQPAKTPFMYHKGNKLDCRLIVIDEASMLDIKLAYALLQAVPYNAHIVFVGDADQLPPVGPGNFFRDMINSGAVHTTALTYCFRASGSIAQNAHSLNNGKNAKYFIQDEQFCYLPTEKEDMQKVVCDEYIKAVRTYGVKNCAILAPMRERSSTAVSVLNRVLQNALNPSTGDEDRELKVGNGSWETVYRVDDRVMQIKNDWKEDIANGDMGTIVSIEDEKAVIEFDSDHVVQYNATDMANVTLAYAMTVHKSQGSEFACCIVAANSEHIFMMVRNLLYTALSRAKVKVVLVGDDKAIGKAARSISPIMRRTGLKEAICKAP